jgi:hypothetical protein
MGESGGGGFSLVFNHQNTIEQWIPLTIVMFEVEDFLREHLNM